MRIDWTALVVMAGVSITMTVVFVVLLAFGIRLVSTAKVRVHNGQAGAVSQAVGYGLLVLLGLYFIVPQFH